MSQCCSRCDSVLGLYEYNTHNNAVICDSCFKNIQSDLKHQDVELKHKSHSLLGTLCSIHNSIETLINVALILLAFLGIIFGIASLV